MSNFRRRLMGVQQHGGLPAGYQQVEYIESTGTQYIDTGVSGGINASYEIIFNSLGRVNVVYEQYFAGNKSSSIPKLFENPNGTIRAQVGGDIYVGRITNKYKIEYKVSGELVVDDVVIGSFGPLGNGWGSLSWYVFSSHGENNLKSIMSLYKLKMYTDGILVRNYIPCYSTTTVVNSNGVSVPANTKGLYDLVEGKFYTNQGTGEFLYG